MSRHSAARVGDVHGGAAWYIRGAHCSGVSGKGPFFVAFRCSLVLEDDAFWLLIFRELFAALGFIRTVGETGSDDSFQFVTRIFPSPATD